jgi:hypothetical protein
MSTGQRSAESSFVWKWKQCATVFSEVLKMKRYKISPVQKDYFLHFRILTQYNFHIFLTCLNH